MPQNFKIPEELLTRDSSLHTDPDYLRVMSVIVKLWELQTIQRGQGNCLGMTDLLQNLLSQVGISSRIVEVVMTRVTNTGDDTDFYFVGNDSMFMPGTVDTHVVVITETTTPLIIDLTVERALPPGYKIVVERAATDPDTNKIAELHWGHSVVTYQIKRQPRLMWLHEKTLYQKLLQDQRMQRTLNWQRWAIVGLVCFTLINVVLNLSILIFNH